MIDRKDIIIIPKPESLSWDVIHEVILAAHRDNLAKGVFMRTTTLTGEELKARVGEGGMCFVAMHGEKVVGTASVAIVKRNRWYAKGEIADFLLLGIIPEYQGLGIYNMLTDAREQFVKEKGLSVIELDTNEKNVRLQSISKGRGFIPVRVSSSPYIKHYSVVMAKWLTKCPYSSLYCKTAYLLQKIAFKFRYKPGMNKRLGI